MRQKKVVWLLEYSTEDMSQNDSKAKPALLFPNKMLLTLFCYLYNAIRTNYLFHIRAEVLLIQVDELTCLNSVRFYSVLKKSKTE